MVADVGWPFASYTVLYKPLFLLLIRPKPESPVTFNGEEGAVVDEDGVFTTLLASIQPVKLLTVP